MFTQESVNNLVIDGGKFVNGPSRMNLNWGMYTVADVLNLLEWHIEYSPETRKQAKHIARWLEYHGVALSWYFYDEGFDSVLQYPDPDRVTRVNIENATMLNPMDDQYLEFERHYCERTCHWLNEALTFLFVNSTPIRGQ